MIFAYNYIIYNTGIDTAQSYPYEGKVSTKLHLPERTCVARKCSVPVVDIRLMGNQSCNYNLILKVQELNVWLEYFS
jgi:hypothetical protein